MTRAQFGTLLLILGISAWAAYYGLKLLTPLSPPFGLFLAWHLAGVIPGTLLRGSRVLRRLRPARREAEPAAPDTG